MPVPIGLLKYPTSEKGGRLSNTFQKKSRRRGAKGSGGEVRQQELAPWPWADTYPVARMSTKRGCVELIILEGGSGRALAFSPGHLSISALPGQSGNSMIAGHRDTHFRFLQFLKLGDALLVEISDGRKHVYGVSAIDVVYSRRVSLVLDTDESMISLVACYLFEVMEAGSPMRYVVSSRLVF